MNIESFRLFFFGKIFNVFFFCNTFHVNCDSFTFFFFLYIKAVLMFKLPNLTVAHNKK